VEFVIINSPTEPMDPTEPIDLNLPPEYPEYPEYPPVDTTFVAQKLIASTATIGQSFR